MNAVDVALPFYCL